MTNISQEVYDYLNKLREFPTFAIPALEKKLQYFKGNVFQLPNEPGIITKEGESAIRECIQFLQELKPLDSYHYSRGLSQAAFDHAYDLGPKGIAGHQGTDGSSMGSRIERYGKWSGKISEIISYGSKVGQEVVLRLIIDDGNPNRGNRITCFSGDFKYIGVGTCMNDTFGNMCVLKFAEQFTPHDWYQEKEQEQFKVQQMPAQTSFSASKQQTVNQSSTVKQSTVFEQKEYSEQKLEQKEQQQEKKVDLDEKFEKEQMPDDCVSLKKTTESQTKNGKKYEKITRVYKMKDGSEKTVIEENFIK